jgi:hypothetical protein
MSRVTVLPLCHNFLCHTQVSFGCKDQSSLIAKEDIFLRLNVTKPDEELDQRPGKQSKGKAPLLYKLVFSLRVNPTGPLWSAVPTNLS